MTQVTIIMGSASDRPIAQKAEKILEKFNITFETFVASAHRTPARVVNVIEDSNADVFIALAGLSAALPGVVAAFTTIPIIGVPCRSSISIDGWDSILSILQMPPGIPVATVGLDAARNAGILAAQILAAGDDKIHQKMLLFKTDLKQKIIKANEELQKVFYKNKIN